MRRGFTIALGLAAILTCVTGARAKPAATEHRGALLHLAAPWTIGGEGGWDALTADSDARRLYVSHSTRVEVLDLDHGTPLGAIEPASGVHDIAIAADLRRGFVSCGRESSVLVFDLDSLRVLQRIPVTGRNPDAMAYEPKSHRVLAFNGGTANATVIDASSGTVLGTIALGGRPEFAVADGTGAVFVNIEDTSELAKLDPVAMTVVRRWPLAPGQEPSGLAMDLVHRRLFSVCSNKLMVVSDADRDTVIASVPIGTRVDGVAFDARRGLAISSNGEGTVTVVKEISPTVFEVAETDSTALGARTIALDSKTGAVYLSTATLGVAPPATPEMPRPRMPVVPGTFRVVVLRP